MEAQSQLSLESLSESLSEARTMVRMLLKATITPIISFVTLLSRSQLNALSESRFLLS